MTADTTSAILAAVLSALAASGALESLKRAAWFPWLTAATAQANRVTSILLAVCAAVGVHATYTHDGTLTISGLSIVSVLQWLLQHGIYKTVVRPVSGGQ